MSTLEVDRSSLDVVASWFGHTLPKKRHSEDLEDSTGIDKRKQKKVTHKTKKTSVGWSKPNSTVASWEVKPGRTDPHFQGQGHLKDTGNSSVSSFIQQKVNKKLLKATHRKKELGLLKGVSNKEEKTDKKREKHKSQGQDSMFVEVEKEDEEEGEEESRVGMITKQRSVPQKHATTDLHRKKRRKHRRKAKES